MGTVIIILIIVIIAVLGLQSYLKKLSSGCCGANSETAIKRIKVKDKNTAHYPYTIILTIDGMTCINCAHRVENALNQLPGVWATVNLGERKATVRMKQEIPLSQLRTVVQQVGYTVLNQQ